MEAYKATNKDMQCTMGTGTFQYQFGINRAETAKARKSGLHFTEYPLNILDWYPLGRNNRYFLCEAAGDISETEAENTMACTELKIKKELSTKELLVRAMMYMIEHPLRPWQKNIRMVQVKQEKATANCAGAIAIARGKKPKVKGSNGSYLGLIAEENGIITSARLLQVGKNAKPDTWYTLKNNEPVEVKP